MPYWCGACRSYFSVRTGTPLACSNLPLRKWAVAIYLCLTSLKSVSSMKLHRDLGIGQKPHGSCFTDIRDAWEQSPESPFSGPVEVDETYVGGVDRNAFTRWTGRASPAVVARPAYRRREGLAQTNRGSRSGNPGGSPAAPDGPSSGKTSNLWSDPLHRRSRRLQGQVGLRPRGRQALRRGIRPGDGFNERRRVVLVDVEAGAQGHVSQDQPEAPTTLRERVCREAQHPGVRNSPANAGYLVARLVGHRLLYRDLIADNGLASLARTVDRLLRPHERAGECLRGCPLQVTLSVT